MKNERNGNLHVPSPIPWNLRKTEVRKSKGGEARAYDCCLLRVWAILEGRRLQNTRLELQWLYVRLYFEAKLLDILRLAPFQDLWDVLGTWEMNAKDPVTSRPFLMLSSLAWGFFVANSKTSFVFSGGTCFRMIWPGSTSHTSSGINAPLPS